MCDTQGQPLRHDLSAPENNEEWSKQQLEPILWRMDLFDGSSFRFESNGVDFLMSL